MKTYQDLLACGNDEKRRMKFVLDAIAEHKASARYQTALTADKYRHQKNETIEKYQKLLRKMTGELVPDIYTANHKIKSGFFRRFVIQRLMYQLGNGVRFANEDTKKKLGENFDGVMQDAADDSMVHGVSFLFYDTDKVVNFTIFEYVPLYDENTGLLCAGVRFWQIDDDKPLHVTLYELDGFTGYIKQDGQEMRIDTEKRGYKKIVRKAAADETAVMTYENHPSFPFVPLKHNRRMTSMLEGLREQIDAYDLIKSGFANDVDEANMIYWLIENAGGMNDVDIAQFLERLHKLHTAVVDGDDGAKATPQRIEAPFEGREVYLKRLRADLYEDAMALDTAVLSAGNVTATQIQAAYEPLNEVSDLFEYRLIEAIHGLLTLAGLPIEDPTFTRSQIANQTEQTQNVMLAASKLDDETVIELLPFMTPEQKERAIKEMRNIERKRNGYGDDGNRNTEPPNLRTMNLRAVTAYDRHR